jgi:hypothetical protein
MSMDGITPPFMTEQKAPDFQHAGLAKQFVYKIYCG